MLKQYESDLRMLIGQRVVVKDLLGESFRGILRSVDPRHLNAVVSHREAGRVTTRIIKNLVLVETVEDV